MKFLRDVVTDFDFRKCVGNPHRPRNLNVIAIGHLQLGVVDDRGCPLDPDRRLAFESTANVIVSQSTQRHVLVDHPELSDVLDPVPPFLLAHQTLV